MNKFKMIQVMDDGPKATLHEARNMKKNEKAIIKELRQKYYKLTDCESNKEVQALGKLKHENVLKMIEMFIDDTELMIVFEFLPDNLKRVMKNRDKPFSEPETKVIMAQLMSGIAFIHKTGYIHCNLKPELLACNEDATVIKITDFSTAKELIKAPFGELNVQPTWYTAPEVLLGSERYSTPIDVWSAGCIMGELLSGKPILPGVSEQTQMIKMCDFLGTFTRSEWPEGIGLSFNINYNLPKHAKPQGFASLSFDASSDAKQMILDMLKWCPQKRKTAEQCLNDPYLVDSAGEAGFTELEKLESWKYRWQNNIASDSLEEFDMILKELAGNKQSQNAGNTGSFNFNTNNPLLGDTTPRGGQRTERSERDPYGMNKGMEQTQRNGFGTQRSNFDEPMSNLEEEVLARQERRGRPNMINNDQMFDEAFGMTDRQDKNMRQEQDKNHFGEDKQQSPRGNHFGKDKQQSPRGPAMSRAERLKRDRPVMYETIYGKGLSYALGGNGDEGNLGVDIYGNKNQGESGGQTTARNGNPNFATQQSTNFGQTQQHDSMGNNNVRFRDNMFDDQTKMDQPTPRKDQPPLNDIKFKDHVKEAKDLYIRRPIQYKQRYGDNYLRSILGQKPPGSMSFPDENEEDKPARSRRNDSSYTPTWAEKGKTGRGNRTE